MDATGTSYVCSVKDCDMTFENEDHLDCHEKKHNLMLSIESISKNNEVTDQTPTPTRFLRNCEEVGLFQDLQHVNPFEETFKKAVELGKDGVCLQVPQISPTDDTLHTPHILPYMQNNEVKPTVVDHCLSNEFIPANIPMIVVSDDSDDMDVKNKIKSIVLKNKAKSNVLEQITSPNKETAIQFERQVTESCRDKVREMNRAAQHRCRQKKQIKLKRQEEEMDDLKRKNKQLKIENSLLKNENVKLKEMLLECHRQLNDKSIKKKLDNVLMDVAPSGPILIPVTTNPIVLLQNPKNNGNKKLRQIYPKSKS